MSTEAVSAVSADLSRVASAQAQLAAAHAVEAVHSGSNPNEVAHGHAAVEAAVAALAQAQTAEQASQAAADAAPVADPHLNGATPASPHFVDTVV